MLFLTNKSFYKRKIQRFFFFFLIIYRLYKLIRGSIIILHAKFKERNYRNLLEVYTNVNSSTCNESSDSEVVFSYLTIASYSSKLSFCKLMDLENKEMYAISATYLHKKCETCYILGKRKSVTWWKLFWKMSACLLLFYFHPLSFFFYFMHALLKKTARKCSLFYHFLCSHLLLIFTSLIIFLRSY